MTNETFDARDALHRGPIATISSGASCVPSRRETSSSKNVDAAAPQPRMNAPIWRRPARIPASELRPAVAPVAEPLHDRVEVAELEDVDRGVARMLLLHRGEAGGLAELVLVARRDEVQLGVVDPRLEPVDGRDRDELRTTARVGGDRRLGPAQQLGELVSRQRPVGVRCAPNGVGASRPRAARGRASALRRASRRLATLGDRDRRRLERRKLACARRERAERSRRRSQAEQRERVLVLAVDAERRR